MKHEYGKKTLLLRLAFVLAALSVTLSIGGFIDFLATIYPAEAARGFVVASGK